MGVSERFACRGCGQHRTTQRHQAAETTPVDPDAALRQGLRDYAKAHPRWGHRRAYHDARGEGWLVNRKKVQRLWREEGLRVPQRRRRKRVGSSTAPDMVTADAPNTVWAVDFQFDSTTDGRPVKIVSIVDEHTRECLGGLVERSTTGDRLIDELDRLAPVEAALRLQPFASRVPTMSSDTSLPTVGAGFIGYETGSAALGDYQHYPASNVPVLTDAVRLRDFIEWIGSLDGKPKKPSFDKCSYLGKCLEGVALEAVAEAHLVLFRSVDVGECHHVLRTAGEIDQLG